MSHHLRISIAGQKEVIERALEVDYEMKAHFETCKDCNDESGICESGKEIWSRVKEGRSNLKRVGFDQGDWSELEDEE